MTQTAASAPFQDHFSAQADAYARYRPDYPAALFAWLASVSPDRDRAWDCATGSGQAAVALAAHFEQVVATDASADQLRHAFDHPRVRYAVAPAEASGLEDASVSLITVAQALHWFDRPAFFREAERVLRPGGVLAAWMYRLFTVSDEVDRAVWRLYTDIVGPYWPGDRKLIDQEYAGITLPFEHLAPPRFDMEKRWTMDDVLGYLGTWSAVRRYRDHRGEDPVAPWKDELAAAWGAPGSVRTVRWPLTLLVSRKPGG